MTKTRLLPLILTLFLHVAFLFLVITPKQEAFQPPVIVPITLHNPPVLTQFAAQSIKPPVKKTLAPKPKPRPKSPVLKPVIAPTPEPPPEIVSNSPEPTLAEAGQDNNKAPNSLEAAPEIVAAVTAAASENKAALKTLPPPSAHYLLDVVRTETNVANPYYGESEIDWKNDQSSYTLRVNVSASILFVSVRLITLESEGAIGQFGVQPTIVTETRFRRSAVASHFNYDEKYVSFSASTAKIAMENGAQDQASVWLQLTSIANADASQFIAGREITIQVVESKEANLHQFTIVGKETINTKMGAIETWHVVRPPRLGVYSSRLDIWLAPQYNWLPVQVRNTEANGAITTQTVRKFIQKSS